MALPTGIRWTEWLTGAAVVLLTLATYLVTMYPGLGGGGDAAKFRYLGHVLGTAHPPGYPLYVVVSWLFSVLPFGTLAYRINLMSAVCGALAAGATYISVRSLGGARAAAVAAALGLGFGRLFWSKAALAEVYALAGFLTAATIAALLKWRQTQRSGWLLWAVAFASLAFGNHLTVAFAVPAFVAFALLNDARTCLRPRMLRPCAAMIFLGVAQYGFIVLRTYQHAPYLESKATNLRELWEIVTARRYAGDIFAFTWRELFAERVPAFLSMFRQELTVVGAVLLAVGVVWLFRTRWRELSLFVLGLLGISLITLNVSADSEGFILPAFAFAWPIVGVGLHALFQLADRTKLRRVATGLLLALAVAIPSWQVAANFTVNNHSRRVFEDIYFGSLFEILPPKAVIPAEEYAIDQVVFYELLGAEAARGRDIRHVGLDVEQVRSYIDRGYSLFAFSTAKTQLEGHGLVFEPVHLLGQPLSGYLETVRPGWVVAVAGTPGTVASLPPSVLRSMKRIGATGAAGVAAGTAIGVIGVSGGPAGSAVMLAPGATGIMVQANTRIGQTDTVAAVDLRVSAGDDGAVVSLGGRDVVRAASGIVIAVLTAGGRLVDASSIDMANGLRVPIDMRQLPLYRMTFAGRCEDVGNTGWKDVSLPLGSGATIARIDNYRAFDASMVIYAASEDAFSPAVTSTAGTGQPRVVTDVYDTADRAQAAALTRRFAEDGIGADMWRRPERRVVRISIAVNDGGDYSTTTLNLGRKLLFGLARATVDLNNPRRATLCSVPPPG
ncbi:MAG: DUF2723 domain-containing protein [Acidobacteria bacterium]|nr:DUF2723 domain-containing protein [Acidobacteriota bacterium]